MTDHHVYIVHKDMILLLESVHLLAALERGAVDLSHGVMEKALVYIKLHTRYFRERPHFS
jgi:hypothetical protein